MIVIKARSLLSFSTEELWNMLEGSFRLRFDADENGNEEEIVTNSKETLYSSYGWDFHRKFPLTPLLKKHHVQTVIGKNRLGSRTHLNLLGNIAWSTYFTYKGQQYPTIDILAKMIYEITNLIYVDLSYRQEAHVVSLDILDFIEVIHQPEAIEVMTDIEASQKGIDKAYGVFKDILYSPTAIPNNPISQAVRANLVNINQVLQCVGPRGFVTDVDSNIFKIPIMRGFVQGLRSIYDLMIESRSCAKALFFAKAPLQEAEYFARRLQLLCQTVKNLHHVDCGSTKYLLWNVKPPIIENGKVIFPGDLQTLEGKFYLDEENKVLKSIKLTDAHLYGKTIKMRSVIAGCSHPDPDGVCAVCFGELSYSVPENTNLGHMCCTHLTQQSSQSVLSVKHLDGSAGAETIVLSTEASKYLKVPKEGNSYLLLDKIRHLKPVLVFASQEVAGLTDVDLVDDVTTLTITRISEIESMSIQITDEHGVIEYIPITVAISKRHASMTYPFLKHIKENRWYSDDKGNYRISMEGWDYTQEFLTLPLKHVSMSEHSNELAEIIESSVTKMRERDHVQNPQAVLVELSDVVNSRLKVNLAVLEVILYGACIVSMKDSNFSLPKTWTHSELGVSDITINGRSMAASLAYEKQKDAIFNAASFRHGFRPNHPLDCLIRPREVIDNL